MSARGGDSAARAMLTEILAVVASPE